MLIDCCYYSNAVQIKRAKHVYVPKMSVFCVTFIRTEFAFFKDWMAKKRVAPNKNEIIQLGKDLSWLLWGNPTQCLEIKLMESAFNRPVSNAITLKFWYDWFRPSSTLVENW